MNPKVKSPSGTRPSVLRRDAVPNFESRPLVRSIRIALSTWFADLQKEPTNSVILRGYKHLPIRAGFDLDVLVTAETLDFAIGRACEVGRQLGLMSYSLRKSHSGKVLWLSVANDPTHRCWLLLDIQTRFSSCTGRALVARDISMELFRDKDFIVPIPDADWWPLFLLISAMKKGSIGRADRDKLRGSMQRESVRHRIVECLGTKTELEVDAFIQGSDLETNSLALLRLANTTCIDVMRRPPAGSGLTWRAKVSRFLFYNLFFIHRHHPPLIVVTGADGVGKSTLITHLMEWLAEYPIPVDRFHHLTDTKGVGWERRATNRGAACAHRTDVPGDTTMPRRSWIYRVARCGWRNLMPGWFRKGVIGGLGEIRYARRVNALIGDTYFAGRACILDRYCYDRKLKLDLEERPIVQRFMARLNCHLMRPPRLVLVLCDEPERIHRRKPELSVSQIADYQARLSAICLKSDAKIVEVKVAGRTPKELLAAVAGPILDALGVDLVNLVGVWEVTRRPRSEMDVQRLSVQNDT